MIRKLTALFIIFFTLQSTANATACYTCQNIPKTKGNVFEKITGVDYIQRKGIEKIIQQYLRYSLKSKINFRLEVPNSKALRKGEFSSFRATAKKIRVDDISISDFEAKSLCSYNRFLLTKEAISFPYDIPTSFETSITTDDMNYMTSKMEQKYRNVLTVPMGNVKLARIQDIQWKIENSKARLTFKIHTPIFDTSITMTTGMNFINGQLNFIQTQSQMDRHLQNNINRVLRHFNPFSQAVEIAENAKGYLDITELAIKNDKIYVKGVFLIPKNCVIKR
jgi:hypothetical protein